MSLAKKTKKKRSTRHRPVKGRRKGTVGSCQLAAVDSFHLATVLYLQRSRSSPLARLLQKGQQQQQQQQRYSPIGIPCARRSISPPMHPAVRRRVADAPLLRTGASLPSTDGACAAIDGNSSSLRTHVGSHRDLACTAKELQCHTERSHKLEGRTFTAPSRRGTADRCAVRANQPQRVC